MAFPVTFTLMDAFARKTTRRYTSSRALIADAVTDTAAMLALIEALTNMAVVKTEIGTVVEYATSPAAGANVDAGATLHVRLDNNKIYPLRVPAFDTSKVEADGGVDLDDADVAAFVAAFGSGGHWTVSEGDTVSSLVSGELDR